MTKEALIRVATFLGGIYFFIEYLLSEKVLKATGLDNAYVPISQAFTVLSVMTIGLGLFNLLRVHGRKVLFRGEGRVNSIALLVGLFAAFFAALNVTLQGASISGQSRPFSMLGAFSERIVKDESAGTEGVPAIEVRVAALLVEAKRQLATVQEHVAKVQVGQSVGEGYVADVKDAALVLQDELALLAQASENRDRAGIVATLSKITVAAPAVGIALQTLLLKVADTSFTQKFYLFVFDGLFSALGSAMFALLGVYIASAAYRAFRIRSAESALMMGAAVIVILGQIPLGLLVSESMPQVRQWLLEVPNSAAFRAIRLGAGIGGLLLAIRMWLSLESSSYERGKRV